MYNVYSYNNIIIIILRVGIITRVIFSSASALIFFFFTSQTGRKRDKCRRKVRNAHCGGLELVLVAMVSERLLYTRTMAIIPRIII